MTSLPRNASVSSEIGHENYIFFSARQCPKTGPWTALPIGGDWPLTGEDEIVPAAKMEDIMSQQNIQIQPGALVVSATQHTNGDGDFDGHGPNMWLNVSLYVPNEYELGLNVFVRFEETQSDWTTWQGSFSGIVYDVRAEGNKWKIESVVTPPFNDVKQLNGWGNHHFDYGIGGIVNSIDAIGDSDGGIFGGDDHPGVTLNFNNIVINVQDPPVVGDLSWLQTKLQLPPRMRILRPAA
jgi:hypothetical protein